MTPLDLVAWSFAIIAACLAGYAIALPVYGVAGLVREWLRGGTRPDAYGSPALLRDREFWEQRGADYSETNGQQEGGKP